MTGNEPEAAAMPHWGERPHVFPESSHLLESSSHGHTDEGVESAFKELDERQLIGPNYSHSVLKHSSEKGHLGAVRWLRGQRHLLPSLLLCCSPGLCWRERTHPVVYLGMPPLLPISKEHVKRKGRSS